MGVHGLWELLSPVGRRVSVETLAGKRLAIDASIWMIQFMKAMRDEKGEMVRNAHVLGFFRRICKLLYLRTKPIFVFDGATPALKRRTVIARRRQRENAQAKVRKTAEKLLLNHLKAMKLKQLAEEMKSERKANDGKGKKILDDKVNNAGDDLVKRHVLAGSSDQEKLDETLAASLAAEEGGRLPGNASTSAAGSLSEEDDDDEDEEMILPTMQGNVDPAVLAALPPSMQLDLLVQMRERLMAENRQKYQKVKKTPEKFSELQIQSYLKTVAFRKEIDGVQKSAAGRGVGGVQISRIASEANREFIFSSSFTGDKGVLVSAGAGGDVTKQTEIPSRRFQDKPAVGATPHTSTGLGTDESGGVHENVETYLDERGRMRVSRVRAMGIRMTRDLERNLNMMREIEQGNINQNQNNLTIADNVGAERNNPNIDPFIGICDAINGSRNGDKLAVSGGGTSLEISFEDGLGENSLEDDDDIFARLVVGDPEVKSPDDNNASGICPTGSASDSDWEEGTVGLKLDDSFFSNSMVENNPSAPEAYTDDSEVGWKHGISDNHGKSVLRSTLEEEADLQEAIRRSLEDSSVKKISDVLSENVELKLLEDGLSDSYLCTQSNVPGRDADSLRNEVVEMLDPGPPAKTVTEEVCFDAEALVANSNQIARVSSSASFSLAENSFGCDHVNLPGVDVVDPQDDNLKSASTSVSDERVPSVLQGPSAAKVSSSASFSLAENSSGCDHVNLPGVDVVDPQDDNLKSASTSVSDEIVPSVLEAPSAVKGLKQAEQNLVEEVNHEDISLGSEKGVSDFDHGDIKVVQNVGTEASLAEEISVLDQERVHLESEQRQFERNAESISSEMFAECQELLQMFGLPYIIAPMEAEAQCAYMEVTGFVDGVVTDDSDVFLFGARSVYKNIFDDRKYVETYLMKDIENELGLSREKLIRMALLLGSDYTEGVSGIGIVNAIEVVTAFPDEDGLYKFREWIESPDPTILGNIQEQILSSKKRTSKVSNNDGSYCGNSKSSYVSGQNVSGGSEQISTDRKEDVQKIFMEKHRKVSKNWHIPTSFPSEAVISAYLAPQVDRSTEPFSWGKPDILVLRKLCWEKFAWSNQKADELLLPVLKEYNKHETQLRLESFYTFNERFAKIRSKRIKKAVKGIAGKPSVNEMDSDVQEVSKSPSELRENNSENITGIGDHGDGLKELSKKKLSLKNSRKRKARDRATSSARGLKGAVDKPSTDRVCSENVRVRGRGGARKIRSGMGKSGSEFVAATSSKGASSYSEQEADAEIETGVRRSFRRRRTVNYTEDDFDLDDTDKLPVDSDKDCTFGAPQETEAEQTSSRIISEHSTDGFTDKLPPEILCNTYLERESQRGPIQDGNSSVKVHLSDDYLTMGGGFFVEEEGDKEPNESAPNHSDIFNEHGESSDTPVLRGTDMETDQVTSPHSPKRTIVEPQSGGSIGGSHLLGSHVNRLNTIVDASETRVETLKDDRGHNNSAGVLSAMPFLRRKRRRSS